MIRIATRRLGCKAFSSSSQDSHSPIDPKKEEIMKTRQNPEGTLEFRGYEQLATFNDEDKQGLFYHNENFQPNAFYNRFSKLPSSVISSIKKFYAPSEALLASDQLYLPKIAASSVPLFISPGKSSKMSLMTTIFPIFPLAVLATSHYAALYALLMPALGFVVFKPLHFRLIRGFVYRMDLIPETEEVVIFKRNLLGQCRIIRVAISDLEHKQNNLAYDDTFVRFFRSIINFDFMFKVKSTGEELLFDKDGSWFSEGIDHELLV